MTNTMRATLYLETLGVATIRVGSRHVPPSAARVFGLLLFMIAESGRRVPRRDLQEMFFPGQTDASSAHNLRQLLYRVRGLGTPLTTAHQTVALDAEGADNDYSLLCRGGELTPAITKAIRNGILPGYTPTFSRTFAHWVEELRARIQNVVVPRLVTELSTLRKAGRWGHIEPIATACLSIDPLNDEATLALAESLALSGRKAAAVKLLDSYLEDTRPYGKDLRLSATLLRTRISEYVPTEYRRIGTGPFVGRDNEISELWRRYQAAKDGTPHAVVVHGEPGIGKTRLGTEFLRTAALDGASCLKAECAPRDIRRPFGVFVDLVPKLLDAPGGLGVAPAAMRHLKRLTAPALAAAIGSTDADPRHLFNTVVGAIVDLVDSVAEEQPVVILVDDAQYMDPASALVSTELASSRTRRRCMILFTSRTKSAAWEDFPEGDGVSWLRLRPLDRSSARRLCEALSRSQGDLVGSAATTRRLDLAGGNPLFLRLLMMEAAASGRESLPSSLTDLLTERVLRLADSTLRAFVASVLLGRHCRSDRLARVAGLTERELLASIQYLENQGFLEAEGTDIRSAHPMLSQTALGEFPPVTRRLMHATAAMLLQAEAEPQHNIGMLWDAAEHWHHAGSTDKAVALLRSCADYCVDIGQPKVACQLLQRALVIGSSSDRPLLLRMIIAAARVAEDYSLLRESVRRHRHLTFEDSPASTHDDLELDAIQAERFDGKSLLELVPTLRRCVSAPTASASHRLRAACQLIAAHDLALDAQAAQATHNLVAQIPCPADKDVLHRRRAEMLFHAFAGDPNAGIREGWELLGMVNHETPSALAVRLRVDAALSLFRCGRTGDGTAALKRAFDTARGLGMVSTLIDASSILAWMYRMMRNIPAHTEWDRESDRLYSDRGLRKGRISHYLSNKIEFSLEQSDPGTARHWLQLANAHYSEITTPRSRILALAFSLRIKQLEPGTPEGIASLQSLAEEHDRGKRCGLHDNFTESYWHELARAGYLGQANAMLLQYVKSERRDRFPLAPPLQAIIETQGLELVRR